MVSIGRCRQNGVSQTTAKAAYNFDFFISAPRNIISLLDILHKYS